MIQNFISNYLNGGPLPGIENEYRLYKEFLPGITLEEVKAEASKWLSPNVTQDYFALLMGPQVESGNVPDSRGLLEMVKSAFRQTVEDNIEKKASENLIENLPAPGKVLSQQKNDLLGIVTYTLSNGVKVTVKKTDFKSDEILLEGVRKGGASNFGKEDKSNVQFISAVS